MTQRADFRCAHRLRVRWAEVDMQKIVFNGHYLMYFDTAVADYWRALALPYEATMHALGGDLFVRKATVEYHASARYDEQLDVCVRCQRIGTSSLTFAAGIFSAGKLLVSGELVYVYADPATQTSQPVPERLRAVFDSFEAGADMLDVAVGGWDSLGEEARNIRTEVFVVEQDIPAEMEWDHEDATCVHAVARNRLGMALGTGRLLAWQPGVVKIGRMAVRASLRGSQVGRRVLLALMAVARQRGERQVLLHAQCSAAAFYLRNGFEVQGEPFDEAGIPHIAMVCTL